MPESRAADDRPRTRCAANDTEHLVRLLVPPGIASLPSEWGASLGRVSGCRSPFRDLFISRRDERRWRRIRFLSGPGPV
jgi:hypothetical protein